MSELKRSSKASNRRRKSSGSLKKNVDSKKKPQVAATGESTADPTGAWQGMKEDADVDNYVYGLHDGMVDRVLDEIREKRATRKKITDFVDGFCEAWFKLVKWRWMVLDDERESNTRSDEGEPDGCRKDAWAAYSYGEPGPEKIRSTVPGPMRCCPHPPQVRARQLAVEPPVIGRALKKAVSVPATPDEPRRSPPPNESVKASGELVLTNTKVIPKTAFPERAEAKIVLNQKKKVSNKEGSNNAKVHVSEVDLTGRPTDADDNRAYLLTYSRLDS